MNEPVISSPRVDLLFDVAGNTKLYDALIDFSKKLGHGMVKSNTRKVVRITFKDNKLWDDGGASDYADAKHTYTPNGGYNPVWIGSFDTKVKLPNIGQHEVLATPDYLAVGCQEIPWDVVEMCLKARPKS